MTGEPSQPDRTDEAGSSRPRSRSGALLGCGAALLAVVVLGAALFTLSQGEVRYREFSPDTFRYRHSRHLEVPLLEWRITGPVHEDDPETPLQVYLRAQGFLAGAANPPRWVFLRGTKTGVQGWVGMVSRALTELDLGADRGQRLVAWSESYTDEAKKLWPEVVKAMRANDYERARALLERMR